MKYVGIDVHKKMCQAAILDEDGKLDEIRFANTPEEIEEFSGKLTYRNSFHTQLMFVIRELDKKKRIT